MNTKKQSFSDESRSGILRRQLGQYPGPSGIFRKTLPNPPCGFPLPAKALIAALLCFAACGNGRGIQQANPTTLDLMDRLSPNDSLRQEEHFERNQSVIRKGLRRKAVVMVAPVCIHASLQGVSGKVMLKGWAAPVFNIGDGLQMNLFLTRNGTRHPMGGRYFDPGRRAEDRSWIPIEIPLEIGESGRLEIEISGGPQGDLVADWLALSSLSLFEDR